MGIRSRIRDMRLAVLAPALQLALGQDTGGVVCDAGMSTGINDYGETDPDNTSVCYPTKDSANIVSCNNADTNAAEMTIQISNEFYSSFGSTADYVQDPDDGYWRKTVPMTRSNIRLSQNGGDAELVYEESSEQIQQNGVFFSVQKSITFVCQYSLDDQSLEANFQIAGKDMEFNRVARGELIYPLVPTAETVIGDDHHFQIIPATPNVIYSRITQCTVVNQNDDTLTYGLTTVSGDQVCTDPITVFDITSSGGYCTDQTQAFKYTSFRWSTTTDAVEQQTLRCTIKLEYEKAVTSELSYPVCSL